MREWTSEFLKEFAGLLYGSITHGVQESFTLRKHTTTFQAVVHTEVSRTTGRKIYICSDSRVALKALCSARIRCADALDLLDTTKEVYLVWVARHKGASGNEKVHLLRT